jgi:hypothetical protein
MAAKPTTSAPKDKPILRISSLFISPPYPSYAEH